MDGISATFDKKNLKRLVSVCSFLFILCPCQLFNPVPFPFQNYLMGTEHKLVPISCIKEGREPKAFGAALTA